MNATKIETAQANRTAIPTAYGSMDHIVCPYIGTLGPKSILFQYLDLRECNPAESKKIGLRVYTVFWTTEEGLYSRENFNSQPPKVQAKTKDTKHSTNYVTGFYRSLARTRHRPKPKTRITGRTLQQALPKL